MLKALSWPHRYKRFSMTARSLQLSILCPLQMHLAPSIDIYINVVTCLKSVDDIYIYICICNIYGNIQKRKTKEIWKIREEIPVTLLVKIFLITTKIFLPENYLLREWTRVSPACPTCYPTWHSKTFPFWTWTEERKNCKWIKLACKLSMLLLWWLRKPPSPQLLYRGHSFLFTLERPIGTDVKRSSVISSCMFCAIMKIR
jgi:hypothetical protein